MPISWIGELPPPRIPETGLESRVDPAQPIRPVQSRSGRNPGKRERNSSNPYREIPIAHELEPAVRVQQLMKSPVFTAAPTDSLEGALERLTRLQIRHLPVLDASDQLMGVVSDRDVLRAIASGRNAGNTTVGAIMTRRVLTATQDTELREAARVMTDERVHCLPVVDEECRVVGIITATDLLRCIVNREPLALWA